MATWEDYIGTFPSAATLAAQNLSDGPHSTLHGNLGLALDAWLTDAQAAMGSYDTFARKLAAITSANVVNPTSTTYGAVGDGSTDDTTAIQAALTALALIGGGVLVLPEGQFNVTGITVPSNVFIVGAGVGATTIHCTATLGTTVNFEGTYSGTSSSAHCRNSGLRGVKVTGTSSGVGINLEHASSLHLTDFRVDNVAYGIRAYGAWDSIIDGDWRIQECDYGLFYASHEDDPILNGVVDTNNIRHIGGTIESCYVTDMTITGKGVDGTGTGAQKPNHITFDALKVESSFVQDQPRVILESVHAVRFQTPLFAWTNYDSGFSTPVHGVTVDGDSMQVTFASPSCTNSTTNVIDAWFYLNGTDFCTITDPMFLLNAAPSTAHIEFAGTNDRVDYALDGLKLGPSFTPANLTISGSPTSVRQTFVRADGQVEMTDDLILSDGYAAASTNYVDNAAAGLTWKDAVACATTANVTLSGEQTIDGVLTSTSRVLVKNQSTASQNGIYVSAAGSWSRSTDMDAGSEFPGAAVLVSGGTTLGGTAWTCTNTVPPTVGSTPITFAQFSGGATTLAGDVTGPSSATVVGKIGGTVVSSSGAGGTVTVTGKLAQSGTPSASTDLVTKAYVDGRVLESATTLRRGMCVTKQNDVSGGILATLGAQVPTLSGAEPATSARSVAVSSVSTADNSFTTSSAHNLNTGDGVVVTTTDTLPGGINGNVVYFVSKVSSTKVALATTRERARRGQEVTLSSTGSGTHTLRPVTNDTTPTIFMANVGMTAMFPTDAGNIVTSYPALGDLDDGLKLARDLDKQLRLHIKCGWQMPVGGTAETWASGETYEQDNRVTNSGRLYECVAAGSSTASNAPTHASGIVVGADGYAWLTIGDYVVTGANAADYLPFFTGDTNLGSYSSRLVWPDDDKLIDYWGPLWLDALRDWLDGTLDDGTPRRDLIATVNFVVNSTNQGEWKAGYQSLYSPVYGGSKKGDARLFGAWASGTAATSAIGNTVTDFIISVPNNATEIAAWTTDNVRGGYALLRVYSTPTGSNRENVLATSITDTGVNDPVRGAGFRLLRVQCALTGITNPSRTTSGTTMGASGRAWLGTAGNNTHALTYTKANIDATGFGVQIMHVKRAPAARWHNQTGVSVTLGSPILFTLTAHGYQTGDTLIIRTWTGGTTPTGGTIDWTNSTIYHVIVNNANSFWLAANQNDAFDGRTDSAKRLTSTGGTATGCTIRALARYHTSHESIDGGTVTALYDAAQTNRFNICEKAVRKALAAGATSPWDPAAAVADSEAAARGAFIEGQVRWVKKMTDMLPGIRLNLLVDAYLTDQMVGSVQLIEQVAAIPGSERHVVGVAHLINDDDVWYSANTTGHTSGLDRVFYDAAARAGFPLMAQFDGGALSDGQNLHNTCREFLALYGDRVRFIEGPGSRFNGTSTLFTVTEYLGSSLSGSVSRQAIAMDAQRAIRELAVGRAAATAPLAVAVSTVLGWKHHMAGGVAVTAASVDIDLPADTTAALPIGTELVVVSDTTGTQPTITAGAGATVNSPVATPQITARYGVARCRKTAANTWTVTGDVS